jgi:hypothetical protein
LAFAIILALAVSAAWIALALEAKGTPSPAVRSSGNDAEWLGHAWVDGRKTQSDVDGLAARLRDTGIRDLLVHAGPFRDDGTLDPALRPRAAWLTSAIHTALPGVRVQAWLGAHPVPAELHLESPETRASVLKAVGQILDDGFDGVHYDFEPVEDGNEDLITMLRESRPLFGQRHAILSVSAIHTEPWVGMATCVRLLPGSLTLWSTDYLRRVSAEVDQVAIMAYDTALPTKATYGGYVRRVTELALAAVPANVHLLIGIPGYHDRKLTRQDSAETIAASLHGIRLALGAEAPQRKFGVAFYVDFAATPQDRSEYLRDWAQKAS